MIEVKAEDAAARQLPPIGFSLDARAAGMEARLFSQPGQYLIASGPPGAPLLFMVWTAAPGGADALAEAVQARFGGPHLVVGEACTFELAGAPRPALAFTTGAGMWMTAWCGVLVETTSGALFVALGVGSPKPLPCAQIAAHPSLSILVRSFTLGARPQAAAKPAAYAPAVGIVEDDFGPKFQLPVPKSTVAIRGWEDALIDKASLPRAIGALLGLAVGGARGRSGSVHAGVQLAAAIADVFLKQGTFSTGTLAVRYLDWRREAAIEIGEQVQQALDLVARGCPAERAGRLVWEKRGRAPEDATALVRTAIFGVLFAGQPGVRRTLAFTETAITHFDPCSQLAAAALDAAIGHALTARPSPASMLRAAQDEVREGAAAMRELYPDIVAEIDRAEAALRDDLAAAREGEAESSDGTSPVRATLRLAFYELLDGGDFASAMEDVAARPGDVASRAAVTGALLGAFYGIDAIPADWLDPVLTGGAAPPADQTDVHPRALLRVLARGFGADRDPNVIAQLAPHVARAFPLYGAPVAASGPDLVIAGDWRVTEWLRGSPVAGQARCNRGGERAIATFAMAWTERVAEPAAGVPCIAPMLATSTIVHDGKSIAVMLEAQPAGVPLSTPAFPLRGRQALPVLAQLIAIVQAAAERGVVLAGLRPEGIYVTRGPNGMLLSGILPRADRFLVEAAKPGMSHPFTTTHAAPEVARGGELTAAADVFSACSVFVYLTQRQSIYQVGAASDPQRPPNEVVEFPGALDRSIEDALRAGLDLDPRKRPTAAELAKVLAAAQVVVAELPVFVAAPTAA